MDFHYEADSRCLLSSLRFYVTNQAYIFQAEHLSFPLQAQSSGRTSNLELNAKFKVCPLPQICQIKINFINRSIANNCA